MKSIMKRKKVVIAAFAVIIIAILIIFVKDMLYPNNGKTIYGDRLNGIDKVSIDSTLKNTIVNSLKATGKVKTASVDVKGKIINILIDVKTNIDVLNAKTISSDTLTKFSNDEKKFYDIQYFLTQSESSSNKSYPMIGYKNANSSTIVWGGNE